MHQYSFLCAFVVILLCSSATGASLVPAVCKDISRADPDKVSCDFCVTTLESDPHSSKATAAQLARTSFKLSITKAKDIFSTIGTLLEGATLDQLSRHALKNCSKLYSKIPDDLQAAVKAVKGGDFDKANVRVSAAINKATTCRDEIKEKISFRSLLKVKIRKFHQLVAISLGFTKLLPIIN